MLFVAKRFFKAEGNFVINLYPAFYVYSIAIFFDIQTLRHFKVLLKYFT